MRALSLHRPTADNALLRAAARGPRMRYVIEGAVWAAAYGAAVGALWFGAHLAGPFLRSLG
ncbi:hypothetical protein WJ92_02655 [Burkholderia ubonensis]|uniref:Uncharacterized protein n=1 Tax=Burkholderia ubonensis TaxID=101571 RepID=A0ABD4E947_9BURK|nr:hypothetical protein [Burkholderia ubonensis]KVN91174.1 hypothetical protein WJ68_35365 [Burkholderia ubonensis]KVP77498.1 hypothetical protein WJ92_02655 [Burkholderia ubonensis]KVT65656.1 hypothetical protein WK55_31375 [Burkholderia ubonensis]